MDMFENNVAAHLTRILNSSKHSEVISSARCELLCNIRFPIKIPMYSVSGSTVNLSFVPISSPPLLLRRRRRPRPPPPPHHRSRRRRHHHYFIR